jgi:hypothetical protein
MKRAEGPAASNGSRFQKKRRVLDTALVELSASVSERMTLEEGTLTYPTNRYYAPVLLVDGKRACFKIGSWMETKFGIDLRVWDKGAASSSEAAPAAASVPNNPDTARLNVALTGEMLKAFEALDSKLEQLLTSTTESSFTWQSLVKRSEKTGAHACVKVNFVARQGANPLAATQIKVRLPGGSFVTGVGWAFLEKHLAACDAFKEGGCKVALDFQYWSMNGSAGVTLQAYALALRPSNDCAAVDGFKIDDIFPDADL